MPTRHFSIPALPVSKNVWQRQHWSRRRDTKREWEEWVWALVNEAPRMPRPLDSVRCDVVVAWDKTAVLPDHHNLEMAFEVIADGLVKAGIIRDDSGDQFVRGTLHLIRGKGTTEVILRWE